MASNRAGKGNPASHRMSNEKLKARRARSWARAQVKKARNRAANDERAAINRQCREQGIPTPAEVRRAERRERRAVQQQEGSKAA